MKRIWATAIATAGPKDCANSIVEVPSGTSSVGRTVCTAFWGPEKPSPVARPEKPVYQIIFAKLVSIPNVVINPAAIGIVIEAKSINGV